MTQFELTKVEEWGLFEDIKRPLIISGPCSAESEQQVFVTARGLKEIGINVFRAGIWKPRTRPNCFEGIGVDGLPWLQKVQKELGMKVATEIATAAHAQAAIEAGVDMLWVGARTAANPFSVQEIADAIKGANIPVLIKNPVNPDVELWIGAMERIYQAGITKLGVIHRGFSEYGNHKYRNNPQWQIAIEMKRRYPDLPMICDPSHISGKREYIQEISQKSMDLGFNGLIIESHICPEIAMSDAAQQLTPTDLKQVLDSLVIRDISTDNLEYKENIDELRNQIDKIDLELLDILANRMQVVNKIGNYKKQNNIAILQAGRWDKILATVSQKGLEKGLDQEFVEKVFKAVHQSSIDRQTNILND